MKVNLLEFLPQMPFFVACVAGFFYSLRLYARDQTRGLLAALGFALMLVLALILPFAIPAMFPAYILGDTVLGPAIYLGASILDASAMGLVVVALFRNMHPGSGGPVVGPVNDGPLV